MNKNVPTHWRNMKINYSQPYPRIWWPEHPISPKDGMPFIHRVVMCEMEGRIINSEEHVHHKNENKLDYSTKNLELTSRSEHTREHHPRSGGHVNCEVCGRLKYVTKSHLLTNSSFTCSIECSGILKEHVNWPADDELSKMVWVTPVGTIARTLGISGSAIKKRCRKRGIITPPRGYWSK